MDCEKFDDYVMDALYGELDELTLEALKRHVEGCARCGPVWSGLKGTRSAVTLPLEEPDPALEDRILAAERSVQHTAPIHRKIMRAAAWAGSVVMRPQFAMAAVFMLVVGSSLMLLRARPGTMSPPVQVSEQGRPETVPAEKAAAPAAKGGLEYENKERDFKEERSGSGRSRDDGLLQEAAPTAIAAADEAEAPKAPAASAGAGAPPPSPAEAFALEDPCSRERLEAVAKLSGDARKNALEGMGGCPKAAAKTSPSPGKPAATATAHATATTSAPR